MGVLNVLLNALLVALRLGGLQTLPESVAKKVVVAELSRFADSLASDHLDDDNLKLNPDSAQLDCCTDRWIDGSMDRWIDGQADSQTDTWSDWQTVSRRRVHGDVSMAHGRTDPSNDQWIESWLQLLSLPG